MRLTFAVVVLALTMLPAWADDKVQHNTLTSREIADGWVLLFDGATTFGWKTEGTAKAEDGALVLGGQKETTAFTTTAFGEAELQFDFAPGKDRPRLILDKLEYPLGQPAGNKETWLSARITLGPQKMTVVLRSADTDQSFVAKRANPRASATTIGFLVPEGNTIRFRGVKLKPMGLKPIFNGKDLTGWKEIPGKKSKFTVTAEGELNVKNGNGDLQTEGQWDDFVLQLDVISHGKHLNSGIFFRCLPGEFWSGYEAQIRNQWEGDDRTKPVDYGTGGIYNRQPARKVVSSDNEWFTMTIVAQGNHMAVWVNGYPVSDFTDTRPPDRSARKGTKLDKGPISIQGHDPTTDLSFRNIRLAELARAEVKKEP